MTLCNIITQLCSIVDSDWTTGVGFIFSSALTDHIYINVLIGLGCGFYSNSSFTETQIVVTAVTSSPLDHHHSARLWIIFL